MQFLLSLVIILYLKNIAYWNPTVLLTKACSWTSSKPSVNNVRSPQESFWLCSHMLIKTANTTWQCCEHENEYLLLYANCWVGAARGIVVTCTHTVSARALTAGKHHWSQSTANERTVFFCETLPVVQPFVYLVVMLPYSTFFQVINMLLVMVINWKVWSHGRWSMATVS